MRHPYSRYLYELDVDDGRVIVSDDRDPAALRRGIYDTRGRWISGDRLTVCPNLCIWVGEGPRATPPLSSHRRFMAVDRNATAKPAEG